MVKIKNNRLVGIATFCLLFVSFVQIGTADASDLTSDNVVALINQSRTEAGLGVLDNDPKLTQAATMKANDMFAQQYFAHVGPDGNGMTYWAAQAGYNWTALGENIAYGFDTAESVHEAFMSSSGHRANILGTVYEDVGVAAVSGQYGGRTVIMVVEEFGATNDLDITYALTVNNGTGSGSYESGQVVAITANAPAAGQVFDKWTGDTAYVSDVYSASATVKMPASPISLTATYKDESAVTTYVLTVTNGSGSGSYAAGTTVAITANAPAAGQVFDKWTGDISVVADIYSANTTVNMPNNAVNLTATYKNEVTKYYLTVNGGTGDGWYAAGTQVTIIADAPSAGNVFYKWVGSTSYVSNPASATTVVTMPSGNISLSSKYRRAKVTSSIRPSYCSYNNKVAKTYFVRTMLKYF